MTTVAIVNGNIYTISGGIIEKGTILIEGGKITAVGKGLAAPKGAEIFDAAGKVITPGIIDAHTHLGIHEEGVGIEGRDYNEKVDPVTPQMRAIDGINPDEPGTKDALAGGVTAVISGPGSANVIGGESVAIKTYGRVIDRMVIRQPAGLKVAFGENPKRVYTELKKTPVTRMGTAALLRQALVAGQNYLARIERAKGDPEKMPDRDLGMEAIARVLRREVPMRAHAHRADDMMTAIRIAEEFNVQLTLEHATESHKITDELAKRGIPAVVGPTLIGREKFELRDRTFETPRVLYEAGIKFALMTDHPVIPVQYLPLAAALAVREGLPEDVAMRSITLSAAEIIGVADRIGSIEAGKDADLVIWSRLPLDPQARAEKVFVDGALVYDTEVSL
ncbi:MAG: amidohydrolase [Syntrophothermus sp.]